MPTPRRRLRLVMLQLRSSQVPKLQEQSCFIERCRVARDQIRFINLTEEPQLRWHDVQDAHAVIIGGAGVFSVTEEHPFSASLREVVGRLVEDDRPVFGSCWGHQFLAATFGGSVVTDTERAEVGSFEVELTDAGVGDPLFAGFPRRFWVQLGHHDRIVELGNDWRELAASARCPFQAIRLDGKPVYGTQFHSEMNEERLRQRIEFYREQYVPDPSDFDRLIRSLRPSVHADQLLTNFLETYA